MVVAFVQFAPGLPSEPGLRLNFIWVTSPSRTVVQRPPITFTRESKLSKPRFTVSISRSLRFTISLSVELLMRWTQCKYTKAGYGLLTKAKARVNLHWVRHMECLLAFLEVDFRANCIVIIINLIHSLVLVQWSFFSRDNFFETTNSTKKLA